jgi:hypothetical protein
MKLDKLIKSLYVARKEWGLEACHLELLYEILIAEIGETTIMSVLDNYPTTSPATTHKNLKLLLKKKILTSVNSAEDGRIKTLEKGIKLNELMSDLGEV